MFGNGVPIGAMLITIKRVLIKILEDHRAHRLVCCAADHGTVAREIRVSQAAATTNLTSGEALSVFVLFVSLTELILKKLL